MNLLRQLLDVHFHGLDLLGCFGGCEDVLIEGAPVETVEIRGSQVGEKGPRLVPTARYAWEQPISVPALARLTVCSAEPLA